MQNEDELVELRFAASLGDANAQMALGNHYRDLGDELEAIKWFLAATRRLGDSAERAANLLIEAMNTTVMRVSNYTGESAKRWLSGAVPNGVAIEGRFLINTEFRRIKITSSGGNPKLPSYMRIPRAGANEEKRRSLLNPDWADEADLDDCTGTLNCPRSYTLVHEHGLGIFSKPERISIEFFESDIQQIRFVRDARRGRRIVIDWPFLCRYEIEIQLSNKTIALRYDPPFADGLRLSSIYHAESLHVF